MPHAPDRLPQLPRRMAALFRTLLPYAEREEILDDLAREYRECARKRGASAARLWVWRQLLGSLPALVRRGWWRGMTGFEPQANRLRPGGPMFESWIVDARYAVRRLLSRPAFTALAVMTLALGAGGTAAIFSVVQGLLLDRLPIAQEEQVGVFWMEGSWNETEILHLRPDFPAFAAVGGYRPQGATVEIPGQPVRMAEGVVVTAELFDVLGARPLLGRTFAPGDDLPGAEASAVLSHALWQDLGADPALVGQPLILGGAPRTIIGVMPPGFWFPSPTTRVWVAAALNPQRGVGEYTLVGRVAGGQSLEGLSGPLAAVAARLAERFSYPDAWDKTKAPAITPVREFLIGDVRPGLVATFAAMALIFVIAGVNVTTLMLGQVSGRATELAVRSALGAARQRLVQQLTIEALMLGAAAGAVGALLALAGFRVLVQSLPLGELAETVAIDWTLFWAAMIAALAAATLVGLISATAMWRGNLQGTLATTRTGGVSVRGGRLESGLVVAQIALAVLLAAGAGLLIRSAANLRGIDAGIDLDTVAVIDVTAPAQMNAEARRQAYLRALPSLESLPRVHAVAVAQRVPLLGSSDNWGVSVPGRPELDGHSTFMRVVTPDYFETMGIEVRQGRGFQSTDADSTRRVVVINESMAAKYFPGENPIGRMVDTGFDEQGEEIIGVVENVAEGDLTDAPAPARYMLYPHVGNGVLPAASFVLRAATAGDVPAVVQAARNAIQREAPQLAVNNTTTMRAVFDRAMGPTGQVVTLVTLLAGLALLLSAIGVYGVMSHFVSRRMRDYGICITLGLPPAQVLLTVVRRGAMMVVTGGVIGVIAALALTRMLASLLYGVAATDPLTLAGSVVALVVVGALAALVPARRASLTDPAVVLRQQESRVQEGGAAVPPHTMVKPRKKIEAGPLGSFEEQVMLAVLRTADEAYGMNVRRELEEVSGRSVTIGSVYVTLDRLEDKGLVSSARVAGTGASSRRVFAVTAVGLRALAETKALHQRMWRGVKLQLARGSGTLQ